MEDYETIDGEKTVNGEIRLFPSCVHSYKEDELFIDFAYEKASCSKRISCH